MFQERIKSALQGLVLPPPPHWPSSTAKVPGALTLADLVFVCKDASLCPLYQLYRGPFKALARSSKLLPCRWVPGPIWFLLTASNWSTVLTLFLSSLLSKVDLLILLWILFQCCLLLPLGRILHNVHIMQLHLLFLEDDFGGELL